MERVYGLTATNAWRMKPRIADWDGDEVVGDAIGINIRHRTSLGFRPGLTRYSQRPRPAD